MFQGFAKLALLLTMETAEEHTGERDLVELRPIMSISVYLVLKGYSAHLVNKRLEKLTGEISLVIENAIYL